jgi:hypothetical protein
MDGTPAAAVMPMHVLRHYAGLANITMTAGDYPSTTEADADKV